MHVVAGGHDEQFGILSFEGLEARVDSKAVRKRKEPRLHPWREPTELGTVSVPSSSETRMSDDAP